jgi:hypothetical protein
LKSHLAAQRTFVAFSCDRLTELLLAAFSVERHYDD